MILRTYELPLVSKLLLSGTSLTAVGKTKFGLLKYRPFFINEVLMAEGLYEPHVAEVFKPQEGETVIDIGSNIGYYTLRASRYVGPRGNVVSVEANPETFRILKSNIVENHCDNVAAFCCAAGAGDGYADLYIPSNYPAASTIVRKENRSGTPHERVPVVTIDSLVHKLKLKRVDWIKIDVEGTDAEVIDGCKEVIRAYEPKIIIETGKQSLVQYLRENGYTVIPLEAVIGLVYAYPTVSSPPTMIKKPYVAKPQKQPASILYPMRESWDVMIVLDACRYDVFEKVCFEYLPGNLEKRISVGSNTLEWLSNAFTEYYGDCVYISANPFVGYSKKLMFNSFRMNFKGAEHFHKIVEVWKSGWDDNLGTVPPQAINQAAIKAHQQNPSKRLIVHYLQPHYPYLGMENLPSRRPTVRVMSWVARECLTKTLGKRIGNRLGSTIMPSVEELVGKKFGIAGYRSAYEKNLRIVLKSVATLLDYLQGKIVITADHGELLGEDGMFGHHADFPKLPEQIEVPWLTINRPVKIIHEAPSVRESAMFDADENLVRKKLQALGYD